MTQIRRRLPLCRAKGQSQSAKAKIQKVIRMPVTMQLGISFDHVIISRPPHRMAPMPVPRRSVRWILPPQNANISSKPKHSGPCAVRPRAGSRTSILRGYEPPGARIELFGSTNACVRTVWDACAWGGAIRLALRTIYVCPTYPLSNSSPQIT